MLSSLIGITILVAGFAVILERVQLIAFTRRVISLGRASLQTIKDPSLSDADKERTIQANTIAMFRLLGILLAGMALAVLVPLLFVWVLSQLGWVSLASVLTALTRWDVIAAVSVLGVIIYRICSKWRPKTT